MSERFLKYETEAENSLVDKNGVLLPNGSAGGSAGGYKYFAVSFGAYPNKSPVYKMKDFNTLENPSKATAGTSDVTEREFLDAYYSNPIMLVPINMKTGTLILESEGLEYSAEKLRKPIVSYECYFGNKYMTYGSCKDHTTFEFEAFGVEFAD